MQLPTELARRVVVIAGPTAVGKSALALRLASRLGGEIVSVDSMQIYRGMDVGTAKPSRADLALAPHHLLDVADVHEQFDAEKFSCLAVPAIERILARGVIPILCGGTGLYFKALFEGLPEGVAPDPALRAELEGRTLDDLAGELARRDPAALTLIDVRNPRRVIRALEITLLSGETFSARRARRPAPSLSPDWQLPWFGLSRPAGDLRPRIDARVEGMFREGLVEETRALIDRGLGENRTASQALGYRQAIELLRGARSLADTVELVKVRTRQFAKRQMTWFKNQMRLQWIELQPGQSEPEPFEKIAARVGAVLRDSASTMRR